MTKDKFIELYSHSGDKEMYADLLSVLATENQETQSAIKSIVSDLVAATAERDEYRKALAVIHACDGMPGFDAAEVANKTLCKYPQQ